MRTTRGLVCPVWLVLVVLLSLLNAGAAVADSFTDIDTVFGYGMTYVPPADLTGWFFDSGAPALPVQTDPAQIWTSAANIATLKAWLSIVADLGDDSGSAAVDAAGWNVVLPAEILQDLMAQQAQETDGVPEASAAALLMGGLGLLAGYGATRRIRGGLP